MIKRVAHVCFIVRDLATAVDFYQQRLGLVHGFDFVNSEGKRFGVYLRAGNNTFIELFEGQHQDRDERQSYRHVCLEVDDIGETVRLLRSNGVTVSDPELGDDHSWQAWLSDPDGNQIELHAYTPQSKQLQ
jgi:catechol 2,3-dioxygenase-like lactoylglutathione lyase family enzyme